MGEVKIISPEDEDIIRRLRDGFCLWIGAGITKHLSNINRQKTEITPSWEELINELAEAGRIPYKLDGFTYSQRLGIIRRKLGYGLFQILLREKILLRLAQAIVNYVEGVDSPATIIPKEIIHLAKLGYWANPIVNFNIETITSDAIAGPGGPLLIKCFNPPLPKSVQNIDVHHDRHIDRYHRCIYHPHGAIDMHGICIITEEEYNSLHGSLAFQLAVHSAFMSHLLIVGMSLEDEYLRRQLIQFRPQIKRIFWVSTKNIKKELKEWAIGNDIHVILINDWTEFWDTVDKSIKVPNYDAILRNWRIIFDYAYVISTGITSPHLNQQITNPDGSINRNSIDFIQLAINQGERIEKKRLSGEETVRLLKRQSELDKKFYLK